MKNLETRTERQGIDVVEALYSVNPFEAMKGALMDVFVPGYSTLEAVRNPKGTSREVVGAIVRDALKTASYAVVGITYYNL